MSRVIECIHEGANVDFSGSITCPLKCPYQRSKQTVNRMICPQLSLCVTLDPLSYIITTLLPPREGGGLFLALLIIDGSNFIV